MPLNRGFRGVFNGICLRKRHFSPYLLIKHEIVGISAK